MRSATLSAFALLASSALTACPMPDTSAARMQTAASDFNTDVRFGRISIASDRVEPKERDAFIARRKKWTGHVEIADYELISAKMVGTEDADVVVKYDWYELAQSDLHSSKIKQRWHSNKGTWMLHGEELDEGTPGLLGDAMDEPVARPKNAQFPSIRLGD